MREQTNPDILIIEDDGVLRRSFVRALKPVSENIREAESVAEAEQAFMQVPDIIILDVNLPDGDGVELARKIAEMRPMPQTLAVSGQASAKQAFELKSLGVADYLAKPFSLDEFKTAVASLREQTPDPTPHLLPLVGKRPWKELQSDVRKNLLEQALSRSKGNRTKAAELLGVTRQAIQQMIHEFELDMESYK